MTLQNNIAPNGFSIPVTDKEFFMNKQVKNSVNPLSILIDEHRMSLAIYSLVILTATG
jgi:hypothetical protein